MLFNTSLVNNFNYVYGRKNLLGTRTYGVLGENLGDRR